MAPTADQHNSSKMPKFRKPYVEHVPEAKSPTIKKRKKSSKVSIIGNSVNISRMGSSRNIKESMEMKSPAVSRAAKKDIMS